MTCKKFILTLGLGCCLLTVAHAIPANPKPVTLAQPDGTTITVQIHGDEHHHWLTNTQTGRRVMKDESGYYVEAPTTEAAAGAHRAPVRRHALSAAEPRHIARQGDCNYLVILVSFADVRMTYSNEDFNRWLNVDGYYGTGSVKQYWTDNSGGKFTPEFTVVGPYQLSHKTAYYGAADEEGNYDVDPRSMVLEAVQAAKADHQELDFSMFDNDGDGEMDNCYIIYAGYSQASTGLDNDIWPHSWYMADRSLVIDNTVVYNYSCSQELVGGDKTVKKMDGIGTFTHEFGHILGLRDLYDTDDYDNGIGIHPGNYSLYAHGSYNNSSRTPAGLWAFERNQMGWLEEGTDLFRLDGDMDVTLDVFATSGRAAYIDCQPGLREGKEWIIVENRQQTGWDSYIPGHGLLIYHYDYTTESVEKYWDYNGPNSFAKHPCLYIKAADGMDSDLNRDADTWPGLTGAIDFTDDTRPSARNWHGDPTHTPIRNIREEEDGRVSFQVGNGQSQWDMVRTVKPTHIRATSATLHAEIHTAEPCQAYSILWQKGRDAKPSLTDDVFPETGLCVPDAEGMLSLNINDLIPGTWYTVRAVVCNAQGQICYGSPLSFQTDYALAEAPYVEYFAEDYDAETTLPNTWEVLDHNGDGTVWQLSEHDGGLFYEFDYWNDADDWLISRRQWRVPAHGLLTFLRGVANPSTVEGLEVYVSTGEREVDDFVLQKRFSFANYFGSLVYEEVDLSAYAGQDVYIAFRCTSEKLQDALWLFLVSLTQKLDTPVITHFGATDASCQTLQAEWTPVVGATKYYLWFGRQTDEVFSEMIFVPAEAWQSHSETVTTSAAGLYFSGSGAAVMQPYAGGISDLRFLVLSSGPQGVSHLYVEGSQDGETWTPVGPRIDLTTYDSEGQEIEWADYVRGCGYTQLRFRLDHGGRNCRVKYLTIEYSDGYVYEDLAAGSVNSGTTMTMNEIKPEEFKSGIYAVSVAAGDDWYFYDESAIASFDYAKTAIEQVHDDAGAEDQQHYDLMGRRISPRFKGIVINSKGRASVTTINQ